jgi:F-type H+-transporting ATPase subunit b
MFVVLDIPVRPSIPTLVIELVIFLVSVYLMERMVFSPIRRAWAERDRLIQEGLAASTEGRDDAIKAREDVQRILSEARGQAQSEIDRATSAGGKARDALVAKATEEFRRLLDAARAEISAERERTAGGLQARIVDLALLAAAQVTGENYNQPHVRELAAAVVQREGLR